MLFICNKLCSQALWAERTGERNTWNRRSSSPAYILFWPPIEDDRGVCCMVSTSVGSSRYQAQWELQPGSADPRRPRPVVMDSLLLLQLWARTVSCYGLGPHIPIYQHCAVNAYMCTNTERLTRWPGVSLYCKLQRLCNKWHTESMGFAKVVSKDLIQTL